MKDYEQLYYDTLRENRTLKQQLEILSQEIEIYKKIGKDKKIRELIIKDFSKYLKQRGKYENKRI